MEYRLKQKYIRAIIEEPLLYGKVADAMNIQGPSLALPLRKNSPQFTKKKVLRIIADHLNVPESDLIEDVEPETA